MGGLIAAPCRSLNPGAGNMVARVRTVAFQGIEAVPVDVQVMVGPGKVGMQMVRRINFSSAADAKAR
ncbi:hypothetical protein FJW07_29125 [Mesorhizobium sp. B3-1-9]|uniref:hypothetical protein n=1 Tax=Mesorhizobium sp. B3-1-9 TaxID=2589892 RepID=UPI001127A49A|nr:hypothetical protein [Mesorhizobium sp. B3-1-9]TPI30533.1 hypothetical protein FJW07_29125 [Mesorhizobium sp. B3-1-9]